MQTTNRDIQLKPLMKKRNGFTRRPPVRYPQLLTLLLLCVVLLGLVGFRSEERDRCVEAETAARVEAALAEREAVQLAREAKQMEDDPIRPEAEAAARVIYGTARNHTADAWRNLVWCIINRVESPLYPDTVEGVCRQEAQWMGYSDDNPVLQAIYEVAYEVLSTWHEGGHRLIGQEYIFLSWSEDELVFRDSFEITEKTHFWRVS